MIHQSKLWAYILHIRDLLANVNRLNFCVTKVRFQVGTRVTHLTLGMKGTFLWSNMQFGEAKLTIDPTMLASKNLLITGVTIH